MEIDYYQKYLKYKAKYLELRDQIGSGSITKLFCNKKCCKKNEASENCGCKKFRKPPTHSKSFDCTKCGHSRGSHSSGKCTSLVTREKDCECEGFKSLEKEKNDETLCTLCKHKYKWHNINKST
jgi:hypothetical protein